MQREHKQYKQWIWIELIGFDNESTDYGVSDYLDKIGFVPEALSLLLFTPDFVHTHTDMAEEKTLSPEMCSYAARPYGRDRARQAWTNVQLRGLIGQLQRHGVSVYCSFFNLFVYHLDGIERSGEWCAAHPELYEMRRTGQPYQAINPLKRFGDGTYYEDFFIRKLVQAMNDYGFDGYHGADGYTSPRLPLAQVDYSDDMVGQFAEAVQGARWTDGLERNCDGNPEATARRAEWIWRNKRGEWMRFNAARWESLWRKIVSALHRDGKKAVFNIAWTRDPFEALYRYGVDYKGIAATGVDALIVETVAPAIAVGGGGVEADPHNEYLAMLMTIKAYVPDTDLICLSAIQDTTERWDALRHAPVVLERDILTLPNVYVTDEDGGLQRCTSGFLACLSDGISRDEWNWIKDRWELGYAASPERLLGAHVVWSDRAFAAQLDDYIGSGRWSTHKLVHELVHRGAPLHSVVNVDRLDRVSGPLLLTNSHLYPEEELGAIAAYTGGPVIVIGDRKAPLGQKPSARFADVHGVMCVIYGAAALSINGGETAVDSFAAEPADEVAAAAATGAVAETTAPIDASIADEPATWLHKLNYRDITDAFLRRCSAVIGGLSGSPGVSEGGGQVSAVTLDIGSNVYRLILCNRNTYSKTALIEVNRPIAEVNVRTAYPGMPVIPEGSRFHVSVPGRGTVMLDVEIKEGE